MDVHDEYVPEEGVLVARRTNEPAKGEWFWPGGRLYKGEHLKEAARRVAREELGVAVDLTERFGVYSHFWDTASVEGADSRHTVNIVYRATQTDPDADVVLDDQHDASRFVTGDEDGTGREDTLHEYVRQYLDDLEADRERPDTASQ